MKAVILAVHLTIFFRSAYLSDQELDDPQGEEERLPHYLKDDGIRRVAKLDKLHFNKTLKASRMLVVLFYFSNSGDKKLDNTWKTDEKMLEVSLQFYNMSVIAWKARNGNKHTLVAVTKLVYRKSSNFEVMFMSRWN